MRNEASAISGRSIFKIPDGKCAGIQICPQRTNSPAGILCHFREKYRKQHKIQNNNECLKTVNSAARVSSIKVVKSCYINNSVVKFKGDREKMQLNSLDFMFFLSFICLFYFMVPDKIKNIVLLTASYVFYARGEFM